MQDLPLWLQVLLVFVWELSHQGHRILSRLWKLYSGGGAAERSGRFLCQTLPRREVSVHLFVYQPLLLTQLLIAVVDA